MKTIIGIDPGASGGIAWSAGGVINAKAMPDTRGDAIALIKAILIGSRENVAYHEKISGYIPDGGPSMMFTFGANCERVSCILETLGVRIIEVTPQAWQKSLGLGKKGLSKAPDNAPKEQRDAVKTANATAKRDWKNRLKSTAQKLFPGISVTLRTADALLILEYAIRQERDGKTEQVDLFI